MKMYEKKSFPRTSWDLAKMYKDGKLSFDNSVQRTLTWDNDRKSLLIHTMLIDFPIPPMFCNCLFEDSKNKLYDFVDGKQRVLGTIIPFLNDEFVLSNVPEIELEDGTEININGLKYSELSQEFQDKIRTYSLTVYYYENMDQEDVEILFARLNNGKSLTAIELTRVKAKSIDKIKELSKHELFTSALTEKAISKYTNEDIVIKSWALLNTENPSFETKFIRPLIESADITDEHVQTITAAYDRILTAYTDIKEAGDKEALKLSKRIITRTHLLSIVPIAVKSIADNVDCEDFESFIMEFFSGKKSASINETYNNAAGSGSAKAENVNKRITAITEAYEAFCKKNNTIKEDKTPESKPTTKAHRNDSILDDEWEQTSLPHEALSAYNSTMYA